MRRVIALLVLLSWGFADRASADSLASCAISVTPIPFGNYDPTSPTDVVPTGNVSASCNLILGISLLVAYSVTMSTGSGSYTARKMTGTTTPLYYNLYTNGAMTQIWGDGITSGTSLQGDLYLLGLGGAVKNYTIYAKLPAMQLVAAGLYSDNIVVSITF